MRYMKFRTAAVPALLVAALCFGDVARAQQASTSPPPPPTGLPTAHFQADVPLGSITPSGMSMAMVEIFGRESFSSDNGSRHYGLRLRLVGNPSGWGYIPDDRIDAAVAAVDYLLSLKPSLSKFPILEASFSLDNGKDGFFVIGTSLASQGKDQPSLRLFADSRLIVLPGPDAKRFRDLLVAGKKKLDELKMR